MTALVPTTSSVDLQQARQRALDCAEAAGRLLLRGADGLIDVQAKGLSGDVVTNLDLAAERLILERIRDGYPDHQIIAEESGVSGADVEWTWLVDPLDGSNNIAIGLRDYVVGIALCHRRVPVLGVIHDPVAGQTWSAVRGRGVHCGQLPVERPAARRAQDRPLVLAWTQGHDVARGDSAARALKLTMETAVQRVLQLWAPLMSWMMLARGDIDGIVGYRPESIDLPAGALIAAEAGMCMTHLDGTRFDDRIGRSAGRRSFVAGPAHRMPALLELAAAAKRLEPQVRRLRTAAGRPKPWLPRGRGARAR
jgi:myo-inositol-1(or 4)-monophosphatase